MYYNVQDNDILQQIFNLQYLFNTGKTTHQTLHRITFNLIVRISLQIFCHLRTS